MKTNNPVLDTIVESQTQFINNWMESAKKVQSAFTNGSIASEGQSLFKEYFDKQANVLNSIREASNAALNGQESPQDFFRNWFNNQAGYAKQMADFSQSIQNSFQNFGKPAQDYMSSFGQTNTAFTNIYNAWLHAMNTSYEAMSKNLNGAFNRDVFGNFMQGNQVYAKMQEFFQPMITAMQKGQFDANAMKNYFNAESYNQLARQMFGNLFDGQTMKQAFDDGMNKIHTFFASQNNMGKEFYSQMQQTMANMPALFSGNSESMKDLYAQASSVFTKTFEPLMKVVTPGKEKENAEAVITLMDKMAAYTLKQAELQTLLQNTARKSVEETAAAFGEKFKPSADLKAVPSFQEMYAEWVKTNEKLFTDLFASEEFSKVKGEALNLGLEVRKHFESQFENTLSHLPFVFKSEADELHKTIYELRKQVKELQSKMNLQPVEQDDDKSGKNRKK